MKFVKTLALTLALLMVLSVALVGCKDKDPDPTPAPTPTPSFDAASLVAGFDQSIATTVKLTYVTNYKVDVVRPGVEGDGGMGSFKRDVVATAVVEMDLGTDLYIKVTKSHQDRLVDTTATVTEEILYKKDGKYYYQTSSSAAVEVTDAAAKLVEIFETATYEQIGGLTLDALLYNSLDKSYELKVFGISDTFIEEDLPDPTYAAGENGGLKVTYKPEYVGYRTDGGWSDFPNTTAGYAATVELSTNNKGQVTSMKETYNNASLVFNIMSNPPTVSITGERSFTATYGEAITKAESVDFAPSVAVLKDAFGGTYVVKTFAMPNFGSMDDVANGGTLELGKYVCVMPTANEGYEVDKVTVNGAETTIPLAQTGGWYCFAVAPGANTVEVTFKESVPTNANVTVTNNTTASYTLKSFTFTNGSPSDYLDVVDGVIVPGAAIYGAVVVDSTVEVAITVNGSDAFPVINAGPVTYYCFAVKTGGNYEVVISDPGATPPTGTKGIINVTNNTSYEAELVTFTLAGQAPSPFEAVENGEVEIGDNVWCAIVVPTGTPVTVTVNGNAPGLTLPNGSSTYFCFSVKTAGEYAVVINPAE